MAGLLGGLKSMLGKNSGDAEKYAKYAVEQHNSKENANLKYVKVVDAKEQVVQGTLYHLTIEAENTNEGTKKAYEAKVWVKPWENHQSLESFSPAAGSS